MEGFMNNTHIMLVEDSDFILFKLKAVLIRLGYSVSTFLKPVDALKWLENVEVLPDLIISDVNMPEINGFELTRRVKSTPHTAAIPVILLTSLTEMSDKISGLQAGADDYLSKSISPVELELRVKAILSRSQTEPSTISQVAARTISVFSLRGGVGTTSLSINLAVGLSQLWGIEVFLWDMALSGGHCAFMMNLKPKNSLTALENWPNLTVDDETLAGLLLKHESGIHLLPAPQSPSEAELITSSTVDLVWPYMQNNAAYLIIDCGNHLTDPALTILERSDAILLVLAPELISTKSAVDALQVFDRIGIDPNKIIPVLNNIFPNRRLPASKISPVLGNRNIIEIPYDSDLAVQAITSGRPYVTLSPKSELSLATITLAYKLSAKEMEVSKKNNSSPLLDGIRRIMAAG
jgi:pilus assembly protein CpaE